MVKKTKMFENEVNNVKQLASSYKESTQQIWLAGLGAFAKAQEEGTKAFNSLVKEGKQLQEKTQSVAQEQLAGVSSKVAAMKEEWMSKAGGQIGKLEGIFEERVAKALKVMGVPTSKDVADLHKKLDAVLAAVTQKKTAAPKAAAKAPVSKASVAKKVAAKTAKK
ncbi:MAG: phasin family protein [Cytophagales bacterium]|nr:phasin family protein [Cytophagales bacterium]